MSKPWFRATLISIVVFTGGGFAWGQSTIRVMSSGGMSYLASSQGKNLYYFTKDSVDKSVCSGGCAKLWSPFDGSGFVVFVRLELVAAVRREIRRVYEERLQ